MRGDGIRGAYVGATSGIPLPTRATQATPNTGLVACGRCDLRTRPGAFHICIDLSGDEPALPPKKTKVARKPPIRGDE